MRGLKFGNGETQIIILIEVFVAYTLSFGPAQFLSPSLTKYSPHS